MHPLPRIGAALVGLLLALLAPTAVLAHAELETSTPTDGATVESPFAGPIVLDMTEALADGSEAELLDPGGNVIASANVDGPGARMTIVLDAALAPGVYEVRWTGVATDGHVDRGTFDFTVEPAPPTTEPTPESTPAPSDTESPATSPPPSVVPSPSAGPSPTPDPAPSAGAGDVLVPIVVLLAVVAAGAAYLLTRRSRPTLPR